MKHKLKSRLLGELSIISDMQMTEKAMVPHSSTLAWKIPWMEEPGRLQSMGWLRIGLDWATLLSLFTFTFHFHFSLSCIGEGNGNPLQCSCLESPRDGRAWWASVYGVTQSRTRLKRLSNSMQMTPLLRQKVKKNWRAWWKWKRRVKNLA